MRWSRRGLLSGPHHRGIQLSPNYQDRRCTLSLFVCWSEKKKWCVIATAVRGKLTSRTMWSSSKSMRSLSSASSFFIFASDTPEAPALPTALTHVHAERPVKANESATKTQKYASTPGKRTLLVLNTRLFETLLRKGHVFGIVTPIRVSGKGIGFLST